MRCDSYGVCLTERAGTLAHSSSTSIGEAYVVEHVFDVGFGEGSHERSSDQELISLVHESLDEEQGNKLEWIFNHYHKQGNTLRPRSSPR